jgi:hypothetical protein
MVRMKRAEPSSPNYTRFDLAIAIVLAGIAGAWLLVFAAILIKYGVRSG